MRYLFFDIECCNGRDICEFGYIITDEHFNKLKTDVITIDPNAVFNLTGRKGQKDIRLFFSEEDYYASPSFSFYYRFIKELIEYKDQIIVGHSIANDAKFLRTSCRRNSLPAINFRFNDSQKMFAEYFNEDRRVSLEDAGEIFDVEKPLYQHRSDLDSIQTMEFVKKMCESLDVTLEELIDLCPTCSGEMKDFEIQYYTNNYDKWIDAAKLSSENIINKRNKILFSDFLHNVKVQGKAVKSVLSGKTVYISLNYEKYHFREMLSLVQLIVNHGGTYVRNASLCDYFVTYKLVDPNGLENPCSRLESANDAIAQGKDINIIDFDKLLEILNITNRELTQMPFPDNSSFKTDKNKESNLQKKSENITTIGEILKAQGIDLDKLLKFSNE